MWKSIQINKQNIEHETYSGTLIKCPNKSNYKGYLFWHTNKLIRKGKHSYAMSVSYTDDFEFRLFRKYKTGQVSEVIIDAREFEEMFGVMNENITAGKNDESYLIVEEPVAISGSVEVDECLKNN